MPKESRPIRARSPRTWSSSWTGSSTSWDRLRRVGQAVRAPAGVSRDCAEPSRPLCESVDALEGSAADSGGAEDSTPLLGASAPVRLCWDWAALAARRSPPVLRFLAGLRRWLFALRLFRAMFIQVLSSYSIDSVVLRSPRQEQQVRVEVLRLAVSLHTLIGLVLRSHFA